MPRKRVICELHDSYLRSMMIKTFHSKDGGSCIFRWPFMGRDWWGVEVQESWINDAVEKTAPSSRGPRDPWLSGSGSDQLEILDWGTCPREAGHQAPGWAAQENEKETRLWPKVWGSICCSSVRSSTLSHTQRFQIKWDIYFFSKELCRSFLLCRCVLHSCILVCIVGHGYTTLWHTHGSPNLGQKTWPYNN